MNGPEFRLHYGAAWLDLLATLNGRLAPPATELLDSPRRLGAWFAAAGYPPNRAPNDDDLRAARALRDALYTLAQGFLDDRAPDPAAVRTVNAAAAAESGYALRAQAGELAATRPADSTAALARIARQAIDTLTGPARARLRTCDDATCAGIYLDDTGRRRWCSDRRCGSRARVRAHRARQSQ
jgi:predicted RNA-binding Zn ribbon-like protein